MRKKLCVIVFLALIVGMAWAGGTKHKPVITGTFSGGTKYYTNGWEQLGIAALYMTGSISNFSFKVSNESGYTNILASAYTNELVYSDGSGAIVLAHDGVLILSTTSTNSAKYTFYFLDDTK